MIKYDLAFRKPFTNWKKLLIGILLSMIPVVRWFAKGFIFESSGVGKTKSLERMPEWSDWGGLFFKGFVGSVISVIYMLPAIFVFLVGAGLTVIDLINAYVGRVISVEALKGVAAGTVGIDTITPTIINNWPLAIPYILRMIPILMMAAILGLLAKYVLPMAILNYMKSERFEDAFRLGEIFRKAFTAKYFWVWVVITVITVVLFALLGFFWFVGFAVAYFFVGVFGYTLFGQVFKEA
jgi:hypothetical protein